MLSSEVELYVRAFAELWRAAVCGAAARAFMVRAIDALGVYCPPVGSG
ncbi:hypothetical protein [Streptomyces sp. NPDC101181]